MLKRRLISLLIVCLTAVAGQAAASSPDPKAEVVTRTVVAYDGITRKGFVSAGKLYEEGWDTLAQARFWQRIISLSHDSMLVNVASERRVLECVPSSQWHCQTEAEKSVYKRNLSYAYDLPTGTELYVTGGKKFFFEYTKVLPMISKSVEVFESNGTDPWFAQAILLIESPGKTEAVSYVGARGPFQLMPSVARRFGLVVSKYRDDRTNLEKSALAASKLINTICIPYARKILDEKGIVYNERDTWFRLFVLHIYHAGAGNVAGVVNVINPREGGMSLIREMWQTQYRGFKNESQNYSQIALASMLLFDRMISAEKDTVFLVSGDRMFRKYQEKRVRPLDTLSYLNECIAAYETDFMEGSIPFAYFATQTGKVRAEKDRYYVRNGLTPESKVTVSADESDRLNYLGKQLLYKRKVNEAIQVFEYGIQKYPVSPANYDSLSYAYKLIGKPGMSAEYTRKSKEVMEDPMRFLKSQ